MMAVLNPSVGCPFVGPVGSFGIFAGLQAPGSWRRSPATASTSGQGRSIGRVVYPRQRRRSAGFLDTLANAASEVDGPVTGGCDPPLGLRRRAAARGGRPAAARAAVLPRSNRTRDPIAMVNDDGELMAVADLGTNPRASPSTRPQQSLQPGEVQLTVWHIADRQPLGSVAHPGREVPAIAWYRDRRMVVGGHRHSSRGAEC